MSDSQNLWLAPAALYPVLAVALVLTVARAPRSGAEVRRQLVAAFLVGIACQCAHMYEEYITGLHERYPPLLGLDPVPAEFFIGLNLTWIGIWGLSAVGAWHGYWLAYFPIWFFALAMCLNGVIHPLLAIWTGGYFPGLWTSPVAGFVGVVVTRRLLRATDSSPS